MRISPLGIQFQGMAAYKEELMNAANISVILKDGRKIPLTLRDATTCLDEGLDVESCISTFDNIISDPEDIRYLMVDNQKYDLEKIEKNQKQK